MTFNKQLRKILEMLEKGNEAAALDRLSDFVESLKERPISALMFQYIITDFFGEIKKLGEKYQLKMTRQNASLLLSVKNVSDFETVAKKVICEFSESYETVRKQFKSQESKKICEYIQAHFTEYDISCESVAAHFHISVDLVRQAVVECTGKLYRDYLIFLRIEYAKELLLQEDISVADLCQKIGYGNVSYFIKLFRESTGVTPAKYRRSMM